MLALTMFSGAAAACEAVFCDARSHPNQNRVSSQHLINLPVDKGTLSEDAAASIARKIITAGNSSTMNLHDVKQAEQISYPRTQLILPAVGELDDELSVTFHLHRMLSNADKVSFRKVFVGGSQQRERLKLAEKVMWEINRQKLR